MNLVSVGNGKAQLSDDYYSISRLNLSKIESMGFKRKVGSSVTGLVDVYSFSGSKDMVKSSVSKIIDLRDISDVYILAPDYKRKVLINVLRVIAGISMLMISLINLFRGIIWSVSYFRGIIWSVLYLICYVWSTALVGKQYAVISTSEGDYTVGNAIVVPYIEDMIEEA